MTSDAQGIKAANAAVTSACTNDDWAGAKTTPGNTRLGDYTLLVGIIIGGALTNAMVQWKHARAVSSLFDLLDFAIAIIIASFSGTMFALGAAYFSADILVLHGVSGAGAFLGLTGLNKVTDVLLDVLVQRAGRQMGDRE